MTKRKIVLLFFITATILTFAVPPPLQHPLLRGVVTSGFGERKDPIMGGSTTSFHNGIDIVGERLAPVYPIASGRVLEVWHPAGTPTGNGGTYSGHPTLGGMAKIKHANGDIVSKSGHMREIFVHEEQLVDTATVLGIMGSTGKSTGPHLHLELQINPSLLLPTVAVPRPSKEVYFQRLLRHYSVPLINEWENQYTQR